MMPNLPESLRRRAPNQPDNSPNVPDNWGQDAPAFVGRPDYPADKSVGPAITDLITEMRRVADGQARLLNQAALESRERLVPGRAQVQADSNGDGCVELFQVPQGATGYLMLCAISQDGVTPASPVTAAGLWLQICGTSGGLTRVADVIANGSMLDASPLSPAADAQVPYTFTYGDRYAAPSVVGPQSFYVAFDSLTASRTVFVRYNVLVAQPEP